MRDIFLQRHSGEIAVIVGAERNIKPKIAGTWYYIVKIKAALVTITRESGIKKIPLSLSSFFVLLVQQIKKFHYKWDRSDGKIRLRLYPRWNKKSNLLLKSIRSSNEFFQTSSTLLHHSSMKIRVITRLSRARL